MIAITRAYSQRVFHLPDKSPDSKTVGEWVLKATSKGGQTYQFVSAPGDKLSTVLAETRALGRIDTDRWIHISSPKQLYEVPNRQQKDRYHPLA